MSNSEASGILVDEVMSRLPREWLESVNYDPHKLATCVENLLENLMYLDGTERGFALAWDHYQKQFESVIQHVYSKHAYQLSSCGHDLPDLIQQTYEVANKKKFLQYNGRAQLHILILFYAQQVVRKIARHREPLLTPPPPPPTHAYACRLLKQFVKIGVINEREGELIISKYYVGLSSEEIAVRYNIPRTNDVDKQITMAKGKIHIYVTIESTIDRGCCIDDICNSVNKTRSVVKQILDDFKREGITRYRVCQVDKHGCEGRYFFNP